MQDAKRRDVEGAEASATDPESNSALRRQLYDLLNATSSDNDLEPRLQSLEAVFGDSVHSELIHVLTNLRFSPEEARRHWREISLHRNVIQLCLDSWVDPRVAVVDYFLTVERRLQNPKIIEMSLFERTHQLAYRDELTGLYNYRFFREHLAREVSRCQRNGTPLSLLMLDIDDFKRHNDRFGHDESNAALTRTGHLLTESLRQEDVAIRFGGEEFAVMLPATPKTGAAVVAEKTRQGVETGLATDADQPGNLTVSIGIATFPADAVNTAELVRQADHALYTAKAQGKNRVELFGKSTRSHRRVELTLSGRVRTLATEYHDVTTVNIGTGGMLLRASQTLPVGSLVEIDLTLPGSEYIVSIPGEVINVKQKQNGTYEAAVRTTDIASQDRALLTRYLPA